MQSQHIAGRRACKARVAARGADSVAPGSGLASTGRRHLHDQLVGTMRVRAEFCYAYANDFRMT